MDGTLYPNNREMKNEIDEYVYKYIETLEPAKNLTREQIVKDYKDNFKIYNQGCRTIEETYPGVKVDLAQLYPPGRYGLRSYLTPDKLVIEFVKKMKEKGIIQIVMTNNNVDVAKDWLTHLELIEYFEGRIVGLQTMYPYAKPDKRAFEKLREEMGINDWSECVLFEDSYYNIKGAKALGLGTVLIESIVSEGEGHQDFKDADYIIKWYQDIV